MRMTNGTSHLCSSSYLPFLSSIPNKTECYQGGNSDESTCQRTHFFLPRFTMMIALIWNICIIRRKPPEYCKESQDNSTYISLKLK